MGTVRAASPGRSEVKMQGLPRMGGMMGMGGAPQAATGDSPQVDIAENVQILSLVLFKMLKYGCVGVPMEVMGLMLGQFVDVYTVKVVDVFAMPQSGTGVSVEAVDPVFQTKMLEMLKQTGREEMVVGWYHSHPGFGCWLSGVDINTQQSFEALNQRAVAVVVDPIQSVKGRVVIEAYRLNSPLSRIQETRDITSIYSMVNNPSFFREDHGLNKYYYSLRIGFRKNTLEEIITTSIYQKDCEIFFKKKFRENLIHSKIFRILKEMIVSIKEICYEESFLLSTSNMILVENFKYF